MKNKPLIIYQDNSLIAANKPARLASVTAINISFGQTLFGRVQREITNAMNEKAPTIYPLHRLDYATSGVVLFGKNPKERFLLENIHQRNETKKIYLALTKGCPPAKGAINFPIPARHSNVLVDAHTEYQVIIQSRKENCSLIKIKITTGRKHQIRRHFARLGFPIVLDDEYGNKKFNRQFRLKFRLGRHFLHAWKISFKHPITEKYVQIVAPLAPDLAIIIKRLNMILSDI
jgi:RluA family pseudouridine synthase